MPELERFPYWYGPAATEGVAMRTVVIAVLACVLIGGLYGAKVAVERIQAAVAKVEC